MYAWSVQPEAIWSSKAKCDVSLNIDNVDPHLVVALGKTREIGPFSDVRIRRLRLVVRRKLRHGDIGCTL